MTTASETQEPGSSARVATRLGLPAWLNWRPAFRTVPRERCHYAVFDVGQIPRRYVMSSVRLQIMQTSGFRSPGFACRIEGGSAHIWFWEEDGGLPMAEQDAAKQVGKEFQPWPEPLMRTPLPDGLHLVACGQGYDAVAIENGAIRRTRWFRRLPDVDAWVAFVRDSGRDPKTHAFPSIEHPAPLSRPQRGWRLSSSLVPAMPWLAWGGAAALALAGSLLIIAGIYSFKLNTLIESEEQELARLRHDNAAAISLQQEASKQRAYLAALEKDRPLLTQLDLLGEFAATGLLGAPGGVGIWEWEYRSGRLRILFSVPDEGFNLSDFLLRLEAMPIFGDIRLVPDSPRGTVGIQASLVRRRVSGEPRPGAAAHS